MLHSIIKNCVLVKVLNSYPIPQTPTLNLTLNLNALKCNPSLATLWYRNFSVPSFSYYPHFPVPSFSGTAICSIIYFRNPCIHSVEACDKFKIYFVFFDNLIIISREQLVCDYHLMENIPTIKVIIKTII